MIEKPNDSNNGALFSKINEIIDHLNGAEKCVQKQETWTVKIRKGQTIEGTLRECQKLFKVWRYTDADLDELVTSDRNSSEAYEVSFKANVEADENLKNSSAADLQERGIKGITLVERLQLEIDYFRETGKHLDIENWTLCSGSRSSGGGVPDVRWRRSGSAMCVDWDFLDDRDDNLRSREVLTFVPFGPLKKQPETMKAKTL